MPRLLCFGDSNTYGTQPLPAYDAELPRNERRWPVVCAGDLGWDLTEEGLPGRTTARPCPIMGPHMDGRIGLFIALESHGPIDALAIMLGTNDFKAHFDATADQIAADVGFLLDIALSEDVQARHGGFEPFLIAPPAPFETGVFADEFAGATDKARGIAALYAAEADKRDVGFFDAGRVISCSDVDGIHFDATAHEALGHAVAAFITSEIERG
ncbi:GDSL-type esterase/lipase family protein [Celeribacter sp.]|uniref:GDSL-type esterase/lipase family protein n=1 Tax=Celeribacter sp. TaxID=1890673 RepID=UPI003A93CB5E